MIATTRWALALTTLLGAGVLVPSCSDDGDDSGSDSCTFARSSCEFGCDADYGCVECFSNSDCAAGAPICVLGMCSACASNNDCATGQVCDLESFTCTTKCTTDADCLTTISTPLCDTTLAACVGCLTDASCTNAAYPLCDPTRRQCSQCISRDNCGVAAPACNLQTGICEECLVDADCNDDALACGTDHTCHPLCTANTDCTGSTAEQYIGSGSICNTDTGVCVECLTATDCTDTATPLCSAEGQCTACSTNADCPSTTPYCTILENQQGGGWQNNGYVCVACIADTDCTALTATPYCSTTTGACVACTDDTQCAAVNAALPYCSEAGVCSATMNG